MSKPNHSPGVPELLRSIAAALDELSTGDPYDYSRIPSDDARALRALADRLEKPTEGMMRAVFDSYAPGLRMGRADREGATDAIIAAIAAATEGM